MFCPSIIFIEPCSSELLCFIDQSFYRTRFSLFSIFAAQSFSANPVGLIYYVYPSIIFIKRGSSDLLRVTPQSFLANPVLLIFYFYPSIVFSEIGPSDFLCLIYLAGWWLELAAGAGRENIAGNG